MPRPEDKPHPLGERPGKGLGDDDHPVKKEKPVRPVKEEETGGLPPDPNAPHLDQTLPGDLPPDPAPPAA